MLQVAVANMHRHGLVHGDLKPENALLSDDAPSRAYVGYILQSQVLLMQKGVYLLAWHCSLLFMTTAFSRFRECLMAGA